MAEYFYVRRLEQSAVIEADSEEEAEKKANELPDGEWETDDEEIFLDAGPEDE